MRQALKSEFRKLLTVRSTYLLSGLALLLVAILCFYASGFKASSYDQLYLQGAAGSTATLISFFVAIISVLLMAHEYRYSTINYTLTLSNSRSKVLLAKIISVLTFSVVLTTIALALSVVMATIGASVAGHHLPHQSFDSLLLWSRSIFYCTGFAMAALLITVLIRNITASIAVLFLFPNTIEGLLGILLKNNAIYLPFTALQEVMNFSNAAAPKGLPITSASPKHGAIVFLVYLVVGWAVAWYLFLKRDAS